MVLWFFGGSWWFLAVLDVFWWFLVILGVYWELSVVLAVLCGSGWFSGFLGGS